MVFTAPAWDCTAYQTPPLYLSLSPTFKLYRIHRLTPYKSFQVSFPLCNFAISAIQLNSPSFMEKEYIHVWYFFIIVNVNPDDYHVIWKFDLFSWEKFDFSYSGKTCL